MQVSVRTLGYADAQRRLRNAGRRLEPVLRGTLNTTATKTRNERIIKPMKATIKGKRLRQALKIKRANTRRTESRIIPSSSGVLIADYAKWGYDAIDATRGRIWVTGLNGKKVAAGFVNPSSAGRKPLISRGLKGGRKVQGAMGPSAAYWFKQLSDRATINWTNAFLQKEFKRRVEIELKKP
jgi:hypothetical protein